MSKEKLTVEYRDVPDFPGYRVGSDGSVWSCRRRIHLGFAKGCKSELSEDWKQLKPVRAISRNYIYFVVSLYRDGKLSQRKIAHLVLEAFVGPKPKEHESRHLNRNTEDNALSNLEWGTAQQNSDDKKRHGTNPAGQRNPRAKITDDMARYIKSRDLSKPKSKERLAKKLGVSVDSISRVLNGKQWKHIS